MVISGPTTLSAMNNVDWYSPGGLINQYLEKELKIAHTVRILLRSPSTLSCMAMLLLGRMSTL